MKYLGINLTKMSKTCTLKRKHDWGNLNKNSINSGKCCEWKDSNLFIYLFMIAWVREVSTTTGSCHTTVPFLQPVVSWALVCAQRVSSWQGQGFELLITVWNPISLGSALLLCHGAGFRGLSLFKMLILFELIYRFQYNPKQNAGSVYKN